LTPDSTQRAAAELAGVLSTDQRNTIQALADAGAGVGGLGADLEVIRAHAAELAGEPIGRQRLRRVLYELGATSTRYRGAARRVRLASPGRPLVESRGGHGGASARRHRLTAFAGEVLAAVTQAQEVNA